MTPIRGRGRFQRERFSIALPNSFSSPQSEFFKQPAGPLGAKFPDAVIPTATFAIPKYVEEDLQQILKIVLEVWTLATSEEPQDKLLKARSLNVYYERSYIECYNFCQQY